jgi:hypothetical protein
MQISMDIYRMSFIHRKLIKKLKEIVVNCKTIFNSPFDGQNATLIYYFILCLSPYENNVPCFNKLIKNTGVLP